MIELSTTRPGEVLAKVADWLTAGTALVWAIDPEHHRARAYRADGTDTLLASTDHFDGDDVLPGFRLSIASLLERRLP